MATGLTNIFGSAASAGTPSGTTAGRVSGQEQTLSSWAAPYVTDMLGKSAALTEQPYQAYQGPLTAGPSSLQTQYFEGLGKMGFPGQLGQSFTSTSAPSLPTMTATGQITPTAAQPTGIAANYMNPYLSSVLAPQLSELQRQAQIAQMNQASKLSQAGAYGGSRQAIMDAELQRNLLQEANKAIGTGYASAYDRAVDQYNKEQAQSMGLAGMLSSAGAAQRAIEAEGIGADIAEFQQQRDYPYKQLQFQQSMLQNMPFAAQNVSYQEESPFVQLLNAQGGLETLYKILFPSTPANAPTTAPKAP